MRSLTAKYVKLPSMDGRNNAKNAKKRIDNKNFAHFAWIYPAKQGFALFAVNGFSHL
jgi:hypothetical protein